VILNTVMVQPDNVQVCQFGGGFDGLMIAYVTCSQGVYPRVAGTADPFGIRRSMFVNNVAKYFQKDAIFDATTNGLVVTHNAVVSDAGLGTNTTVAGLTFANDGTVTGTLPAAKVNATTGKHLWPFDALGRRRGVGACVGALTDIIGVEETFVRLTGDGARLSAPTDKRVHSNG